MSDPGMLIVRLSEIAGNKGRRTVPRNSDDSAITHKSAEQINRFATEGSHCFHESAKGTPIWI